MKHVRYLRPSSCHMVSVVVPIVFWIPQASSFLHFFYQNFRGMIRKCHTTWHVDSSSEIFESKTASRLNGPRGKTTPRQLASGDHASVTNDQCICKDEDRRRVLAVSNINVLIIPFRKAEIKLFKIFDSWWLSKNINELRYFAKSVYCSVVASILFPKSTPCCIIIIGILTYLLFRQK